MLKRIAAVGLTVLGYAAFGITTVGFYGAIAYFPVRAAVVYCVAHPESGEALGLYALGTGGLLASAAALVSPITEWRAERDAKPGTEPSKYRAKRSTIATGIVGWLLLFAGAGLLLANVKVSTKPSKTVAASSSGTSSAPTGEAGPSAPESESTGPAPGRSSSAASPPARLTPDAPSSTASTGTTTHPPRESTASTPSSPPPPGEGSEGAEEKGPAVKNGIVCYPAMHLPAVHLAAVHIPGSTLPGYTIEGTRYPPTHVEGVDIPARIIPGQTIPVTCVGSAAFTPAKTTVRVRGYRALDPNTRNRLRRNTGKPKDHRPKYLIPRRRALAKTMKRAFRRTST